jgi:hypothetical protein
VLKSDKKSSTLGAPCRSFVDDLNKVAWEEGRARPRVRRRSVRVAVILNALRTLRIRPSSLSAPNLVDEASASRS